jgi:PAS domain S-box-containing protein
MDHVWQFTLYPTRDLAGAYSFFVVYGDLLFNLFLAFLVSVLTFFIILDTARIRESETKFRTFFDSIHDSVFIHDLDGHFLEVNSTALKRLGYERQELMATNLVAIDTAEFKPLIEERTNMLLKQGTLTFESAHKTHAGEVLPVEISAIRIEYDGEPAILAVCRDIRERKARENEIRTALEEKEVLLREVHHRVKNNLNVMASLLNLQINQLDTNNPAAEALVKSRDRVFVISQIHTLLYNNENLSQINFSDFVDQMLIHLRQAYQRGRNINFVNAINHKHVDMSQAVPLGLILNELVTNCLKHAFGKDREGEVTIMVNDVAAGGRTELVVADNGAGFPPDVDPQATESLGLRLVSMLAEQLSGELTFRHAGGTQVTLSFTLL